MAENSLNSKGRKKARKITLRDSKLASTPKMKIDNGSISGYTPAGRGFFGLIWDAITALVFYPIFICLWIVVKSSRLFHYLFARIPNRGVRWGVINPLGAFRLFFWLWLCAASMTYTFQLGDGGFPWIALGEYNDILFGFIRKYTYGIGFLPLYAYVAWAVVIGSGFVLFNAADNNEWSGIPLDHYNSPFKNVNETLRFRDAEMAQGTSKDKMKIFAQTGFLTNASFNNSNMTPNEAEAARFLDASLAQQSSSGKLQLLKDLFAGR